MKFLCGSCRTKYQISDEKVRGKILTIRCKKCGSKVMVKESLQRQGGIAIAPIADEEPVELHQVEARSAAVGEARQSNPLASAFEVAMGSATDDMPTSIAPVPANQDDAGVEWYVAIDGAQHGPFAFAEMLRKIKGKEIVGRHYAWHDGMDGWKRVRDLPDFSALVPQDKKKPPPPPPPAELRAEPSSASEEGGKVVDFAQKRAERDRKSTGADHEEPTAPRTASDRVEQLDSVLNEALGIRGEGQTAQAAPKAAANALQAAAGIASPASRPPTDFSDGFGGIDGLPDNLFDAVPRATQGELVSREATKFFVAAAGVNSKKSRNKLGMMAGAGVLGSLGLFFILWASGTIAITIPGLGNPFAPIGTKPEFQLPSGELNENDLEEVRKALGEKELQRRLSTGELKRKRPRLAAGGKATLPGDYVQDGAGNPSRGGTRGGDEGPARIGIDGKLEGGGPDFKPPDTVLPGPAEGAPRIETPDGAPFNDRVVRERINEFGKKAVSDCYRRELMGNANLRGKLEVLMTLQPSGEVSRATVETPNFKGTALGECVAKRLKDLRFPSFAGEVHQFVVPFVLEKGASY